MKTVLLTGATGGLGLPCVRALSKTGRWNVFAAGTNKEKLTALGTVPHVTPIEMDIRSETSIAKARALISSQTEGLDAIVNLAGVSSFASLIEGNSLDEIQRTFDINLLGTARVNYYFFELVRTAGDRIINCSSEAGWMKAQPFAAPYYLSKRAVEAYSDGLRRELMFLSIPVVLLRPGSFETGLTHTVLASFDSVLHTTNHYVDVLRTLKPIMTWEINRKHNPERFARLLQKILSSPKPRAYYSIGTGWLLGSLELLPETLVDCLYKALFRLLGGKIEKKR